MQWAVKVDKPGMKGLRYMTRPKNSWSLVMFVGAGKAFTVSTKHRHSLPFAF